MKKDTDKRKKEKLPVLTPQETVSVVVGSAKRILMEDHTLGEVTVSMDGIQVTLKRKA